MGAEETKKVQDNESKADIGGQVCPSWGVSCEQSH